MFAALLAASTVLPLEALAADSRAVGQIASHRAAAEGQTVQGPPPSSEPPQSSRPSGWRVRERLRDTIADEPTVEGLVHLRSAPPETNLTAPQGATALAATDLAVFRSTVVDGPNRDEINEPSVATDGTIVLYAYNHYMAISSNAGLTFKYINPYTNFDADVVFCCDQRVLYEPTRDLFVWALLYGDESDAGFIRIAVATPDDAIRNRWTYWDLSAVEFSGADPTDQIDFPTIATSANYLYVTAKFAASGSSKTYAAGVARLPLDEIADAGSLSFQSLADPGGTMIPVQGATSTMYLGQRYSTSFIRLYSWRESATRLSTDLVSHTPSPLPSPCLGPSGRDMCGHLGGSVEAGWVDEEIIGFAWSTGSGGEFDYPNPYVHVIEVRQTTKRVVDEPVIWSSEVAFAYPTAALNDRGDLAIGVAFNSPTGYPSSAVIVFDDVDAEGEILAIREGGGDPTIARWGDYHTIVPAGPSSNTWLFGTFTKQGRQVESLLVWFGRERDGPNAPVPTATPSAPSAAPTPSAAASPTPSPTPSVAPQAHTVYLPNVTKTLGGPAGWQTPFIVQNVGDVPTDLDLHFYRFSDGAAVTQKRVMALHPGTSFAHVPNSDPDLPDGGQFSVVVRSSSSRILAVVNQHQGTGGRSEALSYTGLSTGSTKVFLPYMAKGADGWLTTTVVQNLGTIPANVTVSFISLDGSRTGTITRVIAPGRSQFIDPSSEAALAGGIEYSATISADQPVAAVVNAHNDSPQVPAPRGFSYNGLPQTEATSVYLPYVARNADRVARTSRVFVQNAGPTDATPTVTLQRLGGGGAVTLTRPGTLRPGAGWALDPRFLADGVTECPAGDATCVGEGEWSAVVSGGRFVASVATLTALTAFGYEGVTGAASSVFLPNTTRTLGGPDGWTTPIIIQSVDAPSATVSWYRFSDGVLAFTQPILGLTQGASVRIDPRSVAGLAENTQYAVVVESPAGGLAAIVTEQHFSGGDSTMAYTGLAGP